MQSELEGEMKVSPTVKAVIALQLPSLVRQKVRHIILA